MSKKTKKRTLAFAPAEPYSYPQYPSSPYPHPFPQPVPAPADMHNVSITVLSSHGATVARVTYASVYNTGTPVSAAAAAKREPGDKYDAETGRLLATSRALEILAGKLRKQANSRIRAAAAIKGHHEEIASRPPGGYPRPPRPGEMSFRAAGPVYRVSGAETGSPVTRDGPAAGDPEDGAPQ